MCVDMCIDTHVDMHIDMCVDMCVHMHVDLHVHMRIDMHVHMCIDTCVHMHIHMHIDMRIDMHIDMRIDMHIDLCVDMPPKLLSIDRSLYHVDGHEKIAKLYGIWIHGCVDGYSRFIVYMQARTDKKAETVHRIYVDACMDPRFGWPSRTRFDKGTENRLAVLAQIAHHWDGVEGSPTLRRGSAITGRSTQNCRIEYMWRYVRVHVTGKFRAVFRELEKRGWLDVHDPYELFCLQTVFLPWVQVAHAHVSQYVYIPATSAMHRHASRFARTSAHSHMCWHVCICIDLLTCVHIHA